MSDFLTFLSMFASDFCDFLMSEPIIWFIGLFITAFCVDIILSIVRR